MFARLLTSNSIPFQNIKTASNAPAVNVAAVVTLTPPSATMRVVIHNIQTSYNAAPTGGNILVSGSIFGTYLTLDPNVAGVSPFDCLIPGLPNEVITVTLAAAGAAVTGKVNVQYSNETT